MRTYSKCQITFYNLTLIFLPIIGVFYKNNNKFKLDSEMIFRNIRKDLLYGKDYKTKKNDLLYWHNGEN
jgi:hypothetical protein